MYISRLRLANFRNYRFQDVGFKPGANLITGGNGQGKTNLLEALCVLTTAKSYRTAHDEELISLEEDTALIWGLVVREQRADIELEVVLSRSEGKSVKINSVRRPRVLELIGELNSVGIWVEDVEIIRGEPSVRRRFLNTEISQISPEYCFNLVRYKRVLEHRNRLLKQLAHRGTSDASLDVWTAELVRYGAPLIEQRRRFVQRLAAPAEQAHLELTEGRERLSVQYAPSFPLEDDCVEDCFRRGLEEMQQEELKRGMTLLGPHRDNLVFLIDGRDAKAYASLGQQRTAALSLRLSELAAVQEQIGEPPVLLLDDVFAELDSARTEKLLELAVPGRQVFIATTEPSRLPDWAVQACTVYRVKSGVLEELE
jgi:DNA replication and repair protein RecF